MKPLESLDSLEIDPSQEAQEALEAESSSPRWRAGNWVRTFRRSLIVGFLATVVIIAVMWINIPRRAIAWRIEREVAKQGYNLALSKVSVLRPWGKARLDDLVWTLPSKSSKEQADSVHIDALDVSGSMWSYLMDEVVDVDLLATLPEGTIQADVREKDGVVAITGKAKGVPLEWIPKLRSSLQTTVEGKADLVYDLRVEERKISRLNGTLEIFCKDCAVGDGNSKIKLPGATGMAKNGITIPRLHLGELQSRIVFDNGQATVEKFEFNGDDVKVRAEGTIEIKDGKNGFRPDVGVEVFFDPKLQERSDTFQLMVNSSLKAKLEGDKKGWLGYRWVYYPLKRKSVFLGVKSRTLARLKRKGKSRIAPSRRVDPPRKARKIEDLSKKAKKKDKPEKKDGQEASRVKAMRDAFKKEGPPSKRPKVRKNDD